MTSEGSGLQKLCRKEVGNMNRDFNMCTMWLQCITNAQSCIIVNVIGMVNYIFPTTKQKCTIISVFA